jgi:hypothetical protein
VLVGAEAARLRTSSSIVGGGCELLVGVVGALYGILLDGLLFTFSFLVINFPKSIAPLLLGAYAATVARRRNLT